MTVSASLHVLTRLKGRSSQNTLARSNAVPVGTPHKAFTSHPYVHFQGVLGVSALHGPSRGDSQSDLPSLKALLLRTITLILKECHHNKAGAS